MRLMVAHHLFAQSGGGERLSAAVIDESIKRGGATTIATISNYDLRFGGPEHFTRLFQV
jgi:hypothetical protein